MTLKESDLKKNSDYYKALITIRSLFTFFANLNSSVITTVYFNPPPPVFDL